MTNEQLIALIKSGDRDKMLDLWEQNQGFIHVKAQRVMTSINANRCGSIDLDDLIQTAYIGLDKAVKSYNPDKGFAFITYFGKVLSSVLWNSVGYNNKELTDALDNAMSIETPVGDGPDVVTLEDVITDPANETDRVIDDITQNQIRGIIEEVLSEIDKSRADVIKLYYFYELTHEEISERIGVPISLVKQWLSIPALRRELKGLKARKYRMVIEQFIDLRTNFYLQGSVEHQSSPVETLVEFREQQRNRYAYLFHSN